MGMDPIYPIYPIFLSRKIKTPASGAAGALCPCQKTSLVPISAKKIG
jgi:hypothetical protein